MGAAMNDLVLGAAGLLVTCALGVLSWIQWSTSEKATARQREKEESARSRQRDVELTRWGNSVIELMAELEAECFPLAASAKSRSHVVETLAWRASALVDQGRLFFPNIGASDKSSGDRIGLLDEVIRATYVAQYVAAGRTEVDGKLLRAHVYSARKRFIKSLQERTRPALYEVNDSETGVRVPLDPRDWPQPSFERRVI